MSQKNFLTPWLNAIRFCRMRLFYRAGSSGRLNQFPGWKLRGAIGHRLKNYMGCTGHQNRDCKICAEKKKQACIFAPYYYQDDHKTKGFILKLDPAWRSAKADFQKGETFQFDVTFIGDNISSVHYFHSALRQNPLFIGNTGLVLNLIEAGLVNEDYRFIPFNKMESVPQMSFSFAKHRAAAEPTKYSGLEMSVHTPMEIALPRSGKNREYLRDSSKLTFKLLIQRIIVRTANLAADHCNWPKEDISELCKHPLSVQAETVDLIKYPAKWKKTGKENKPELIFGGFVGTFIYQGNIMPFLELLDAAALLGIGRNTSAGFGQVSCRITD
jgi:hypothetical protein